MDDLRRLLALQQRELESLQRQSDARAASARKAPSSPHLVQLRKLVGDGSTPQEPGSPAG